MYRRTQRGPVVVGILVGAIAACILLGLLAGWHPLLAGMAVVLLLVLHLFHSLTIEVDDIELHCFFGAGIIHRRIALSDIVSATPVRTPWYYSWGIRLIPHGWLWRVSGLDTIELELRSGKRFRIGTDDPQEVVEAIWRPQAAGSVTPSVRRGQELL